MFKVTMIKPECVPALPVKGDELATDALSEYANENPKGDILSVGFPQRQNPG
jgi:hypothetical protein